MHPQRGGIIQAANLAGKSNARCPSARSLVTWFFLEIGKNPRMTGSENACGVSRISAGRIRPIRRPIRRYTSAAITPGPSVDCATSGADGRRSSVFLHEAA